MSGRKAAGLVLALTVSASVTGTTDVPRAVADAAARGDVAQVQELLRSGADVTHYIKRTRHVRARFKRCGYPNRNLRCRAQPSCGERLKPLFANSCQRPTT